MKNHRRSCKRKEWSAELLVCCYMACWSDDWSCSTQVQLESIALPAWQVAPMHGRPMIPRSIAVAYEEPPPLLCKLDLQNPYPWVVIGRCSNATQLNPAKCLHQVKIHAAAPRHWGKSPETTSNKLILAGSTRHIQASCKAVGTYLFSQIQPSVVCNEDEAHHSPKCSQRPCDPELVAAPAPQR